MRNVYESVFNAVEYSGSPETTVLLLTGLETYHPLEL
jgi:hypothetical protein